MRIPEISNSASSAAYLESYRDKIASAQQVNSDIKIQAKPDIPDIRDSRQADGSAYALRGDVQDFDWDRIRRFVDRYAWDTEPPDSIKDIRDFWANSKPLLSWDGDSAEFNFKLPENRNVIYGSEGAAKPTPAEPKGQCSTCESRRYVDKSSDSSVSYQTPTKLSPSTAALAVGAHEREHVVNSRAEAQREDRKITNQTVSIKYGICPECHIMYPTGGVTRTQTISNNKEQPPPENPETTQSEQNPVL